MQYSNFPISQKKCELFKHLVISLMRLYPLIKYVCSPLQYSTYLQLFLEFLHCSDILMFPTSIPSRLFPSSSSKKLLQTIPKSSSESLQHIFLYHSLQTHYILYQVVLLFYAFFSFFLTGLNCRSGSLSQTSQCAQLQTKLYTE